MNLFWADRDSPVNWSDATGLTAGRKLPKIPKPPRQYTYKALPGANFTGSVSADEGPDLGYVHANVQFNVPADWAGAGKRAGAATCGEIKIVQIITYEEGNGGVGQHDVQNWKIDNQLSNMPRSGEEFYAGTSGSWKDSKMPPGSSWLMDGPGARAGVTFDSLGGIFGVFGVYYLTMEFRDYAVAIGGLSPVSKISQIILTRILSLVYWSHLM